jgi:membrane protease YdiL (CAAX protease family)
METTPTPPRRSLPATIFISPSEPRLRAGWRLFLHTLLLIVLGFCLVLTVLLPMQSFGEDLTGISFAGELAQLIAITLATYLARRFLDRRSFASLGFKLDRYALYDILAGIVITFFMMGFIFLLEWSLGWVHFESFAWEKESALAVLLSTLPWFGTFILVGWQEELFSRGYHLQNLADGLNMTWGVILSSSVFGLLHLGNPNATWVSAVGIFCAGVFLAYGYLATRQLWLPIGLHIGWNFFEGVVFGFPVSGLDTYRLINHTVSGPGLWTGGAFGPEAGLVALPGLVLGAMLIYIYTRPELRPKL